MNVMELNPLSREIHVENHKWWHDKEGNRLVRNKGQLLMLVVSELAEAMEGLRKNLPDDKLPHRPMVEVEMGDVVIRGLDYAAGFDLPILQSETVVMTDDQSESLLRIVEFVCRTYAASEAQDSTWEARLISSVVLSCFAFCDKFGYDLAGAIREKREFNKTRKDHTHEAREGVNGKKF